MATRAKTIKTSDTKPVQVKTPAQKPIKAKVGVGKSTLKRPPVADIVKMATAAQATLPEVPTAKVRKAEPVVPAAPLPPTVKPATPAEAPITAKTREKDSFQINIRVSRKLGKSLGLLTEKYGSTRAAIAHLVRDEGYDVEEFDLAVREVGPKRRVW